MLIVACPWLAYAPLYLRTVRSSRPGVYRCAHLLSLGETRPRGMHESLAAQAEPPERRPLAVEYMKELTQHGGDRVRPASIASRPEDGTRGRYRRISDRRPWRHATTPGSRSPIRSSPTGVACHKAALRETEPQFGAVRRCDSRCAFSTVGGHDSESTSCGRAFAGQVGRGRARLLTPPRHGMLRKRDSQI